MQWILNFNVRESRWYLLLALSMIFITNTAADLSEGLIGYYPFNGNGDDLSGNGHHGAVTGALLIDDWFGNPNSAF